MHLAFFLRQFFLSLVILLIPLQANQEENFWVLKRKLTNLHLDLKQVGQQFFFSYQLDKTAEVNNFSEVEKNEIYYEITFNDLYEVIEIKKKFREKTVLEIKFFSGERIAFMRESTENNVIQERNFNSKGYLTENKILFPPNSHNPLPRSKKIRYLYDDKWNLKTINFYLDEIFLFKEEHTIIEKKAANSFKIEVKLYDNQNELSEYYFLTRFPLVANLGSESDLEANLEPELKLLERTPADETNGNNKGNYTEIKEVYSPKGELISTNLITYQNNLKVREVTGESTINFYYNKDNLLISKTIKDKSGSLFFSERYQYQSIPTENYLLFNPLFNFNQVKNKKLYLDEWLVRGKLELSNHYHRLASSYTYYQDGDRITKSIFRIFGSNIETLIFDRFGRMVEKAIYNYLGERIGYQSYNFYINGYIENQVFQAEKEPTTSKIKYLYQELPLSKRRYEICSAKNLLNQINFNFALVFFENFYQALVSLNDKKENLSLATSFQEFVNKTTNEPKAVEKVWLKKLEFVKTCKIKKIIVTDEKDAILAYVRIRRVQLNNFTRVFFDYYRTPRFNFKENRGLDYYRNNFPNLIEEESVDPTPARNYTSPEREGREDFLFKANDEILSFQETRFAQIEIEHNEAVLFWAQKTCFNQGKNISIRINFLSERVIGQNNNFCPLNYFP